MLVWLLSIEHPHLQSHVDQSPPRGPKSPTSQDGSKSSNDENCSLVISAACHPPPDDVDPQLQSVQWGVVPSRYGGDIGHSTFTSKEVTAPENGKHYA